MANGWITIGNVFKLGADVGIVLLLEEFMGTVAIAWAHPFVYEGGGKKAAKGNPEIGLHEGMNTDSAGSHGSDFAVTS